MPSIIILQEIDKLNLRAWKKCYTEPKESKRNCEQALNQSIKNNYEKGKAYANLTLGIINFHQSVFDQSENQLNEALSYFEFNINDKLYSFCINYLGNHYDRKAFYAKAYKKYLKALKIARNSNSFEGEAKVLQDIGQLFFRLEDYTNAGKYLKRSLIIYQKLGNKAAEAACYNRLGRLYSIKSNYSKALENYDRSLKIRKELNLSGAIPWTLLGMAETFEKQKNYKKSIDCYEKGLKAFDSRVDPVVLLQCLLGKGRIYTLNGNIEKASKALITAEEIALKHKLTHLSYNIYQALANYYEAVEETEKAYESFKKYHKIKDEILNSSTQNLIKVHQIGYEVEVAEQQKMIYRLKHIDLKHAHQNIQDSIINAKRIQKAILPTKDYIQRLVPNHFILFLPRDEVSGDFYWVTKKGNKVIITAADCTGHGVPGAFLSLLGISFLNEIVNNKNVLKPNEILKYLRIEIKNALKQEDLEQGTDDGIDMALCTLDVKGNKLQFAGAKNPLYIIRNNDLIEIKGDKMDIGIGARGDLPFTNHTIDLKKSDKLYLFSDGFPDQFGGIDDKKIKYGNFKNLLLSFQEKTMFQQKNLLKRYFNDWKGKQQQTDDVIVIGIKI